MAKGEQSRTTEAPDEAPVSKPPEATPAVPPETEDWETRFKYLLADFDNFRRRTERDRAGARLEAEASLLRRLIPLVEGFQKAEGAGKSLPASDPLRRGLELLGREVDAVLGSVGFAPVAHVGEPFRSEEHEAVGEALNSTDAGDGEVAEIVQQGYRFQGGLLRPAKVLVARAPKGEKPPPAPTAEPGAGDQPSSTDEESSA